VRIVPPKIKGKLNVFLCVCVCEREIEEEEERERGMV